MWKNDNDDDDNCEDKTQRQLKVFMKRRKMVAQNTTTNKNNIIIALTLFTYFYNFGTCYLFGLGIFFVVLMVEGEKIMLW